MCMCYIKDQIQNQDNIMRELRRDETACHNPVRDSNMCRGCLRMIKDKESTHVLYGMFKKKFKDYKLISCQGEFPNEN